MRLIAVTTPDFWRNGRHTEPYAIQTLLEERGFWRVHIRKPNCTAEEMKVFLAGMPLDIRRRLTLHDHFGLAPQFGIGGIQLNSRNRCRPEGWNGLTSCSCHSLQELMIALSDTAPQVLDYATLSPIYDSISKPGYSSAFSLESLKGILPPYTVALGGVTMARLTELEEAGFYGAAMLSEAWRDFI